MFGWRNPYERRHHPRHPPNWQALFLAMPESPALTTEPSRRMLAALDSIRAHQTFGPRACA